MQEDKYDCSMSCLAMIDARMGLFGFSGNQGSGQYLTDLGYKYFMSRIAAKKEDFAKHKTFQKAVDLSQEGLNMQQIRVLLNTYGIRSEESKGGPFVGGNIDALRNATHKRPIIAFIKRFTGGDHVVVVDGFTKDEKHLIVCDPDKDTDTENTCRCTLDYE